MRIIISILLCLNLALMGVILSTIYTLDNPPIPYKIDKDINSFKPPIRNVTRVIYTKGKYQHSDTLHIQIVIK